MEGWTDRRTDGWTDGRTNGLTKRVVESGGTRLKIWCNKVKKRQQCIGARNGLYEFFLSFNIKKIFSPMFFVSPLSYSQTSCINHKWHFLVEEEIMKD